MVGTYTLSQLILWLHLFFSKDYWNVFKRKGLWDDWSPSHRCLGLNWMAGGVRTPSSWTWVRKWPGNCWSPCRLCIQWPGMPRADKKCQLSYRWPLHILTPGFLPERGMVTGGEVWGHLWGWINVWCLVFTSAHKVCSLVFFRSRKTSERIWESTILVMCQLPNIYVY